MVMDMHHQNEGEVELSISWRLQGGAHDLEFRTDSLMQRSCRQSTVPQNKVIYWSKDL